MHQLKQAAFNEKQVYLHLCEKCSLYIALNDQFCQFCAKSNEYYEPNNNVEPEYEVHIKETVKSIYQKAEVLENENKVIIQPKNEEKDVEPIIDIKHEDSQMIEE